MPDVSAFDKLKTKVEKQILTVLDFLLTDNQITNNDVINISQDVLDSVDKTKNTPELYTYLNLLLNKYKILSPHLKTTLNSLTPSYGN